MKAVWPVSYAAFSRESLEGPSAEVSGAIRLVRAGAPEEPHWPGADIVSGSKSSNLSSIHVSIWSRKMLLSMRSLYLALY
jgi:hypothetical protein